jgi:hypothetical protein
MTYRQIERLARFNERGFPHIVEIALPDRRFRNMLHDIEAFHHERGIERRRGRCRSRNDQEYVRWCFEDPTHANEFVKRFGGQRVALPAERPPATSFGRRGLWSKRRA